jgi:hypothetical protein
MKISIICFGPIESKYNGYFIRCYNIAKSLFKLGHKVLVMEFSEKNLPNLIELDEGVKIIQLKGNEPSCSAVSRVLRNTLSFDLFHLIKFQLYSLVELTVLEATLKHVISFLSKGL